MKRPVVIPNELYTASEVCSILGVSRRSLSRYTSAGLLRGAFRRADRRLVFFGRDILKVFYTLY